MRTHSSLTAAFSLSLALALVGCSSQDDPGTSTGSAITQDDAAAATSADPATSTATKSGPSDDDADDGSADGTGDDGGNDDDADGSDDDGDGVVGGGPAADLTPSALAAIETATGTEGGLAYAVETREDGFWIVSLLVAGSTTQVTVLPDGTTVDEVTSEPDDDLDATARQVVEGAQVSLAHAIVEAVRTAEAQLTSAELEEVDGTWVWEVTVGSANRRDVELHVDPTTGSVVATEG